MKKLRSEAITRCFFLAVIMAVPKRRERRPLLCQKPLVEKEKRSQELEGNVPRRCPRRQRGFLLWKSMHYHKEPRCTEPLLLRIPGVNAVV